MHHEQMQGWQVRRIANWANLSTPLGLLVARLGNASVSHRQRGIQLATGYELEFPRSRAFTVGSVIITGNDARWADARPALMRHEERHATQWAACLGLPFLPLYLLAMLYSQWRVADRGAANLFEQLAGLEDGGYRVPTATEVAERKRTTPLVRRFIAG